MKDFLLRSLMFVPGHNERLLNSAARSKADVLLLDIEDSVQPSSNKQLARDKIEQYLREGYFQKYAVFPRVNDRESGHLLKDIHQLTIEGVHGFVYPKSKTGQDVYFFDKLLETIEYEKGIKVGTYKIIPLIETASAVLNAQDICKASSRVIAIAFGCEDFVTDLQGVHDDAGQSIFTARAMIAMAARAHGVVPIDTVHIKVHDLEDLEKNLIVAKNLGFEGMLVLNPKELPLVHQYFSPTVEEVNGAEEMIRLAAKAEEEGKGVTVINGKFVGPPMVLQAKNILKKHTLIQAKP
ncbi:citrate lyase subunit beta/citryl-CoA lyase [Catalinimonas alkaloidigena]|uniref:HpcH/HpaI aldolase/citrate lyase family protein n=1 Tax=Catalinimonas alkaloidigena TaxID=1075417 RepID=UPI002406E88B|nr:CoA ester lyase [Catalinimonas alkaloidigena]MDF9801104.1 citrate lyase subunit beta/citryl-CoA lyase [Catalinimonas alkaloidigena]